jgi:hypothetical protein
VTESTRTELLAGESRRKIKQMIRKHRANYILAVAGSDHSWSTADYLM